MAFGYPFFGLAIALFKSVCAQMSFKMDRCIHVDSISQDLISDT